MLKRFLDKLTAAPDQAAPDQPDALHIAAAGLLATAAMADGQIDAAEQAAIEQAVIDQFGLSAEDAASLFEDGVTEAEETVDLFRFTRVVNDRVPLEKRPEILEMLWAVVLADDELEKHEAALMRQIAGLLHVEDRASARARQRALGQG